MINASFVFGMDDDDEEVFRRTVDWAIDHGITTATFHIQTPYPGTRLFQRAWQPHGRITDPRLGPATTRATSSTSRRGSHRKPSKRGY